jgi:E3 ubiquitin-protein ligase RNF14
VRSKTKECPTCGVAISKSGGCNKVVCSLCSAKMCWLCGKVIRGYEHFLDGGDGGGCTMFEKAEIGAWQMEWDAAAGQAQEAGGNGQGGRDRACRRPGRFRGLRCPRCGRANYKLESNSHMKCRKCLTDACFHCRAVLRGPRAVKGHFAPGGCPQHS